MGIVSEQDLIDTINGTESAPIVNDSAPVVNTPPAATAPPVDAAPVADPAVPAADNVAPVFNFDEELGKLSGGEIKTKEQLAEILSKTKEFSTLEARVKSYEEENTSLKAQVNKDPFANDLSKKLNEFYAKGVPQHTIDAFLRINKIENIDDLQPFEARKLALQIKEGLSSDEAEEYLKGTYKLEQDDPDDDSDAAQVKREQIRLKVDANADREFLKTHKAKVSELPVDNSAKEAQATQEALQKHVEVLTPIAKNIAAELSFKDININGKDGEAAIKMDFEVTPELKAQVEAKILGLINKDPQDFPNTPEGLANLKTVTENITILSNWKNMIATATNTREKSVRAEYHNPSNINRDNDNPNPGKTSKEELSDWILNNA